MLFFIFCKQSFDLFFCFKNILKNNTIWQAKILLQQPAQLLPQQPFPSNRNLLNTTRTLLITSPLRDGNPLSSSTGALLNQQWSYRSPLDPTMVQQEPSRTSVGCFVMKNKNYLCTQKTGKFMYLGWTKNWRDAQIARYSHDNHTINSQSAVIN